MLAAAAVITCNIDLAVQEHGGAGGAALVAHPEFARLRRMPSPWRTSGFQLALSLHIKYVLRFPAGAQGPALAGLRPVRASDLPGAMTLDT